jgi:quercetin dioxygenase-like cupin family protein
MVESRERLTPETLGTGVIQPMDWRQYSSEKATVVSVYNDDDLGIVIWNLEPGQEHSCHLHPACAHAFIILEGEGHYLQHDPETAEYAENPVKQGDMVFIPRQTLHAIRNTSTSNMSYCAVTTNQAGIGYQAILLADVRKAGGPPIDAHSELALTWASRR